jgi:hypothetical protein
MTNQRFLRAFWYVALGFSAFVLILAPTIAIKALVAALLAGGPIPWSDIGGCIGIMAGAVLIAWLMRHWCNFLAGSEICKWPIDR